MLLYRLRRWPNNKTTLALRLLGWNVGIPVKREMLSRCWLDAEANVKYVGAVSNQQSTQRHIMLQ